MARHRAAGAVAAAAQGATALAIVETAVPGADSAATAQVVARAAVALLEASQAAVQPLLVVLRQEEAAPAAPCYLTVHRPIRMLHSNCQSARNA